MWLSLKDSRFLGLLLEGEGDGELVKEEGEGDGLPLCVRFVLTGVTFCSLKCIGVEEDKVGEGEEWEEWEEREGEGEWEEREGEGDEGVFIVVCW